MKITSDSLKTYTRNWHPRVWGNHSDTQICGSFLGRHFEIPANAEEIWVSLSTRETKHSLRVCFRNDYLGIKVLETGRERWIEVLLSTTLKVLETFKEGQTLYLTVEYI